MRSRIAHLSAIQLLVACVTAVLVEDAFAKDWISSNYGDLVKCSLLDIKSVLCLSDAGILYQINDQNSLINYFVDLKKVGSDDFIVSGSRVVSTSENDSGVYVWDKETGILINSITAANMEYSLETIPRPEFAATTLDDTFKNLDASSRDDNTTPIDATHLLKWYSNSFEIINSESNILFSKSFDSVLDAKVLVDGRLSYVAVVSSDTIVIHNISKFLINGDPSSISSFDLSYEGKFWDITYSNDSVVVLTAGDSDFVVKLIKPGNELRNQWSFPKSAISFSGKSILVDKPLSLSTINKVHHLVEETQTRSLLFRWVLRVKTHLAQLGKYISNLPRAKDKTDEALSQDQFGFKKIIVSFSPEKKLLMAKESSDGALIWTLNVPIDGDFIDLLSVDSLIVVVSAHSVTSIDVRTGKAGHSQRFDRTIDAAFKVLSESVDIESEDEGVGLLLVALKFGDSLRAWNTNKKPAPSQYVLTESNGSLQSYKLVDERLVPTWKYIDDGQIILVTKNADDLTTAIGITRADRSVLYKYLNPNLVSIVSHNDSVLKVTLLDGITGSIVYVQEHTGEVIDLDSVLVLQNDNWVVYTYQVNNPSVEQRIVVVDLFGLGSSAVGGDKSVVDGSFNSSIAQVSSKSFLFPERILALKSTTTKFGITIRSVLALTETGSLVELPKFVLNSRRIDDRKMTQEDVEDDFRMMPYDPVVPMNPQHVLNHKIKLQVTDHQQILVQPTKMESSAVVCVVNKHNEFCTIVQPSLSYDILSGSFDKIKLLMTIGALCVAYIISGPFVYSKKLNAKWVD